MCAHTHTHTHAIQYQTNTFQAVIAAKDKETHVLLYYSAVGWTSPDTTDGKKFNGLGAPANNLPILGIGDGKGQERLVCGADESAILNVHRASNVGQKGLWIFTASELEPEPEPEPEPPIPEVKGWAECSFVSFLRVRYRMQADI